jgi:hypothetical protein
MVQVFGIRGDLLVATMSGRVSVKKAVQLGKDIGTKALETHSLKVLVDCQKLTGSFSEMDRYKMVVEIVSHFKKIGFHPKIAIVGQPPSVEGFGVKVAQTRGANIAMFFRVTTAMEWLRGAGKS